MALLIAIGHRRGLVLIPVACVTITFGRIYWSEPISIVSWFRADELLAGATLALVHEKRSGAPIRQILGAASISTLFLLLVASGDSRLAVLPYLRPYLAAAMVGASLYNPPIWLRRLCEWRLVIYLAAISYALYVFHGILASTWLGTGHGIVKYVKRPLLLAVIFVLAHLSTFHYEKFWNNWARRLTRRPPTPLRREITR
jgi:peptidoglycan/LPS O-acetylase OafA/YrhL